MKDKIFENLQKFSRSLVVPVLFLPIVGLLFAFFSIFTNPNVIRYLPFLNNDIIRIPFTVAAKSLISVFSNLTPIFTIGIAFGLAKKDKANAALVSFMSLFVYLTAQNTYLSLTGQLADKDNMRLVGQGITIGIQSIEMGIFIAMIIGIIVSYLWNKYIDVQFGEIFSIYAGSKFVFLLLIPTMIVLAIVNAHVWPPIQAVINLITNYILQATPLSMFVYGFLDRLLIPTGLHHLLYNTILYTSLGGTEVINGETISGAYNIGMHYINDPTATTLPIGVTFTSFGLTKMFGLVGAAYAMIKTAKKEKVQKAKSMLIPAMITSFLVGVTEPIEFAFLFVSPILFFIYSILSGIFVALVKVFGLTSIMNRGFIEFALVNIPAGAEKTKWVMVIVLGIVQAIVYFIVFKWYIVKFNIKTIGREDEEEVVMHTKEDFKERSKTKEDKTNTENEIGHMILEAIGGVDNILTINNCFTRLRLDLKDLNVVNDDLIKKTNSRGILKKGTNLQIVYGTNVAFYRNALEKASGMTNVE